MIDTRSLRQIWMPVMVIIAGLTLSFWPTWQKLISQWLNNDDFSHGLLIIPICLYLIWERRQSVSGLPLASDWRALPLICFAILLLVVGELGAELFTTRVSLLVFFIGTLWLLYGWPLIKTLAFPLLFLFLMLPLPGFIYRNLTFPLQIISSKWAVSFLHFWGIMAYREGNIIDLGFIQLQIVEACNGLRFILPLFTLGVLFAFWRKRPLLTRLVLVAATVPIAIFANVVRIGGTGILSKIWGPELAEGFFHGFSGWVVFMLSFALFFLLSKTLTWIPGMAQPVDKDHEHKGPTGLRPMHETVPSFTALAVGLVLILSMPMIVHLLGTVPPMPLKQPLGNFPLVVEGYQGKPETMDPLMWERVGGQSYFVANYDKPGKAPINFYVAYYEHQRKAGDFIHSPKLCLPGAGWYIDFNRTRRIDLPDHSNLIFNELTTRKGEYAQLVYYWYQGRNRNFTNEFSAKFWMVWDGIWRRRTDGALVRLITNIGPHQSLKEVRHVMDRFAMTTAITLDNFLP